jgi:hypothetical protein
MFPCLSLFFPPVLDIHNLPHLPQLALKVSSNMSLKLALLNNNIHFRNFRLAHKDHFDLVRLMGQSGNSHGRKHVFVSPLNNQHKIIPTLQSNIRSGPPLTPRSITPTASYLPATCRPELTASKS